MSTRSSSLKSSREADERLEFLDQPKSDTPHDQLLLQIRGAVAEYERSLIAERMWRGRWQKYRAGGLLPWTRPRDALPRRSGAPARSGWCPFGANGGSSRRGDVCQLHPRRAELDGHHQTVRGESACPVPIGDCAGIKRACGELFPIQHTPERSILVGVVALLLVTATLPSFRHRFFGKKGKRDAAISYG